MDKSQVLRKLKETGTTFESFTGGYLMQIGKQIKIFEDGQKAPKVLTKAQQNKLLQMTIIKQQKYDERLMQEDDSIYVANRVGNDESEEEQEEIQVPVSEASFAKQVVKKKIKAILKQPTIKYTTPQIDLEELIKLRTENQFIKEQHIEPQKQINKQKNKLKSMN